MPNTPIAKYAPKITILEYQDRDSIEVATYNDDGISVISEDNNVPIRRNRSNITNISNISARRLQWLKCRRYYYIIIGSIIATGIIIGIAFICVYLL